MSEIKHTPTPWTAEYAGGKGSWIKGADGNWSAMSCGTDHDNAEANAAFIVEAVNSFEAHKALIAARDVEIERLKADLYKCALATHDQAFCIQQCAAHIGPETSATVKGLPLAVKHLVGERNALLAAVKEQFCVLFLDGRNEHGSHVLPSFPRSFDVTETNIEDEAETIITEAESLGFAVGDHVWAEFIWNDPQVGDEGRVEFSGYWEFKRINVELSSALNASEREA